MPSLGVTVGELFDVLNNSKECDSQYAQDSKDVSLMVTACQLVIAQLIAGLPREAQRHFVDKAVRDLPIIVEHLAPRTPSLGTLTRLN